MLDPRVFDLVVQLAAELRPHESLVAGGVQVGPYAHVFLFAIPLTRY